MGYYETLFEEAANTASSEWLSTIKGQMIDFLSAFQNSQNGFVKFKEDPIQSQPKNPIWAVNFSDDQGNSRALLRFLIQDINKDGKVDLGIFIDDDSYLKPEHVIDFNTTERIAIDAAEKHLSTWETMGHQLKHGHVIGFLASGIQNFDDIKPRNLAGFLTDFAQNLNAAPVRRDYISVAKPKQTL